MKCVALTACSNGVSLENKSDIDELIKFLEGLRISVKLSDYIFASDSVASGTPAQRAAALNNFYADEEVDAIFDVSGGDIANELLGLIDYELIASSEKEFWGYSDLTTIINAIYTKTSVASVLYQIKNTVWNKTDLQKDRFSSYLDFDISNKKPDLFNYRYEMLQGDALSGIVVGGNIRCFMKLIGTEYIPDLSGKVLLLEAQATLEGGIRTMFTKLSQIGAFNRVSGILLGSFLDYEAGKQKFSVYELLKPYIDEELPVAKTPDIGHGRDSCAIRIGEAI